MTTATIKSAVTQSPRTLWVRNVTGSRFVSNIEIRNSTKSTDFLDINLDQAGVDTLIAELAANAPVDPNATSPEVLANLTAYSDSDLRYRISSTAKALEIRRVRTENRRIADEAYAAKLRAQAEADRLANFAKAEANALRAKAALDKSILDRRPLPGVHTLTIGGIPNSGLAIVTEDRRVFVTNWDDRYVDVTSIFDSSSGWVFRKQAILTAKVIADAAGIVDNLGDWLKLALK